VPHIMLLRFPSVTAVREAEVFSSTASISIGNCILLYVST
jgi:hypothetical protein